jgi:hypothetical protein
MHDKMSDKIRRNKMKYLHCSKLVNYSKAERLKRKECLRAYSILLLEW